MGEPMTSDEDVRPSAPRPGVHPSEPELRGNPEFILEVDGEQFAVRRREHVWTDYAVADYTWLSGPNPGYGFGISGPPNPSLEEHRQRIREFLAMVDPTTGYIEDD